MTVQEPEDAGVDADEREDVPVTGGQLDRRGRGLDGRGLVPVVVADLGVDEQRVDEHRQWRRVLRSDDAADALTSRLYVARDQLGPGYTEHGSGGRRLVQ